ncbi:MAG: hypothetical protein R3B47_15690 [Bacteroidia bacterium]
MRLLVGTLHAMSLQEENNSHRLVAIPKRQAMFEPITQTEVQKLVHDGILEMTERQFAFWETIAIEPEKWNEKEYGQPGSGFWAVAICRNLVIWYNDIEEGFNISKFSDYGKIGEYGTEQGELQWAIGKLLT